MHSIRNWRLDACSGREPGGCSSQCSLFTLPHVTKVRLGPVRQAHQSRRTYSGNSTACGKYRRTATTTSSSSFGYGTNRLISRSIAAGLALWKKITPVDRSLYEWIADQGTSRIRPKAYRRTPSEQI